MCGKLDGQNVGAESEFVAVSKIKGNVTSLMEDSNVQYLLSGEAWNRRKTVWTMSTLLQLCHMHTVSGIAIHGTVAICQLQNINS